MNIEKLAPYALTLAILASLTHSLPDVINAVRRAEFSLIQNSKASQWPKAPMLHTFKRPF
jgi:hypothetical protein